MQQLQELDLSYNNISDISELSFLHNISKLNLEGNQIFDATPLITLKHLQQLNISCNQLYFLPILCQTSLSALYAGENRLSDVLYLKYSQYLEVLCLNGNEISDTYFVKHLPALQMLDVSSNQIVHFNPYQNTTNIKFIEIEDNFLIQPLSTCFQKAILQNEQKIPSQYQIINSLRTIAIHKTQELKHKKCNLKPFKEIIHKLIFRAVERDLKFWNQTGVLFEKLGGQETQ
ncbi:leucine_Rich Repeat (LRR)-containing protein [Hexamita inflata]|uniref:Leucine Rich Repeat (LRR)-containing protein n=1 Tax=Hexamita inflata TaxID=28002 RepID=A0AA86R1M8_9EUKA|nr:leucine Rich Repeat (LRR)-containing protein [Hexamita inflata]